MGKQHNPLPIARGASERGQEILVAGCGPDASFSAMVFRFCHKVLAYIYIYI